MPDLATRTSHETEVASLVLLYLQDLEDALRSGQQVDWLQWTTSLAAALARPLASTFLEAAEQLVGEHDGWLGDGQDRAQQWASQEADWVAARMAATTRNAVAAAQQRWARGVGDNFMADLEHHFSSSRAESVAITETTEAISQGENYGAAELAAIAILLIPLWVTEEDPDVCERCAAYNRDRQNVWQGDAPTGPPLHPGCRCHLQWVRI